MTDEDVVNKAYLLLGSIGKFHGPHAQKNPKHKPFWTLAIVRKDEVYTICKLLYPLMGNRRRERLQEIMKNYEIDRDKRKRHGTRRSYEFLGCRCDQCKRANADRARLYRATRVKTSGDTLLWTVAEMVQTNPSITRKEARDKLITNKYNFGSKNPTHVVNMVFARLATKRFRNISIQSEVEKLKITTPIGKVIE